MSEEIGFFLSYAREDKSLADRIFIRLKRNNIRVWMDKPPKPYPTEGLVPGTNWDEVLHEMIRKARSFMPLFTETAIETGSYFEHELKTALRICSEMNDPSGFIIPVLSGGKVPELSVDGQSFGTFQWIDIDADGLTALLRHLLSVNSFSSDQNSTGDILKLDVENIDQLMAAIGPNRVIRLASGDYNFSEIQESSHEFMSFEPKFDGPQVVFHNLKNTEFCCDGSEPAHFFVEPRYVYPLYLYNCEGIRLRNLRFGHLPQPGECEGGVVRISRSKAIDLNECDLYGCGTIGIMLEQAENIVMTDSLIHDCNTCFAMMENCREVVLNHCTLHNNEIDAGFIISDSESISIADTVIQDNSKNTYFKAGTPMVLSNLSKNVALEGCHITKYPFDQIADPSQGVEILNCEMS